MNIVIFNGSPRPKGNTSEVVDLLEASINDHIHDAYVEVIETNSVDLIPCQGCEGCKNTGGKCVHTDGTNDLVALIMKADVLLFATPVYFWGITAQLKTVIDKFYCMGGYNGDIKKKQVGIITIGGAALGDLQYELISKQFDCIINYFGWDKIIDQSYCAWLADDLRKNNLAIQEINEFWKKFNKPNN